MACGSHCAAVSSRVDTRPSARSLGHLAAPGMVYEDATHHLRRNGEEVRSILPVGLSLADKSKVRLVHQGGRLQDVAWPLVAKSRRRPAAKLLVDHLNESVTRGDVAAAPGAEQSRYVVACIVQLLLPPALSGCEHVFSCFSRHLIGGKRRNARASGARSRSAIVR